MHKYFFVFLFTFFLVANPVFAQSTSLTRAECAAQKGSCDFYCKDGEASKGTCSDAAFGTGDTCCAVIGQLTETQCEQSPKSGGQGGTCKISNFLNLGCESGTQKPVGMCSDTALDSACCVPINPDGSLNPGMSESECALAVTQGGPGGHCGVDDGSCTNNNGTIAGGCTEAAGGADQICCVTEESKAAAEEDSGIAAVGAVSIGTKYTPLENVPFIKGDTFEAYVLGLYRLGLVLIVLSAVFMLVIGGFTYLTSAGNTAAISSAKHIIYGSLIGLVLALVSYIILNTINPDLVNVNVTSFQPLAVRSGSFGGGAGGTATSSLSAQAAADKLLKHPNVTLGTDSGNSCPGGNASAKNNLEQVVAGKGMTRCPCGGGGNVAPSETLLNSLVDIADAGAKFRINYIAGACHSGTSNHYAGTAVDIQKTSALDAFFAKYPKADSLTYKVSGVKVYFEPGKDGAPSNHYHVSLSGR